MKNLALILLLLTIVLGACSPTKDCNYNYTRTVAYLAANPSKGGLICGNLFPPVESVSSSDSFVPGVPVMIENHADVDLNSVISSIRHRLHDSLACALLDSLMREKIKVPCPPSFVQTNNNYKKQNTTTVNKGLLASAEAVSKTQSEKIVVQSVWLKIFGWYSAIVTAYFLLKLLLRWQYPGMVKKLF